MNGGVCTLYRKCPGPVPRTVSTPKYLITFVGSFEPNCRGRAQPPKLLCATLTNWWTRIEPILRSSVRAPVSFGSQSQYCLVACLLKLLFLPSKFENTRGHFESGWAPIWMFLWNLTWWDPCHAQLPCLKGLSGNDSYSIVVYANAFWIQDTCESFLDTSLNICVFWTVLSS